MDDKKKPVQQIISGSPSLKCSKCGAPMNAVPTRPGLRVCSQCGNRAGTVRLQ